MNDLYRNELRLYKNFFQPVMKIVSKVRIGGTIHKKQGGAMTPHKRLLSSQMLSKEEKRALTEQYEKLNPAELKRTIDVKLLALYHAHQRKNGLPVEASPKVRRSSVVHGVKVHHSTNTVSVS